MHDTLFKQILLLLENMKSSVDGVSKTTSGQIEAVSIHKPTLEDVFIRRTGRRFEEAQA